VAERLRLFNGATELNYGSASITESNNYIINQGVADIEADTNVTGASFIDFKKSDGSTTVFTARVVEKTKDILWKLTLMTNGYELNNLHVETVWESKSPEYIVQDIVDNYTENLTYVPSIASGITITKYIGNAYAIDIIKDMVDLLQWELIIDKNDNVSFQPKGKVNNGVTFTNGTNVETLNWKEDQVSLFNHVKVVGGFESYAIQETISGTGTTFTLSKKPQGSMRITVSGTEISPEDYEVDAPNKQIIFTSSQTDPLMDYSYSRPIIVENQDDASVALYGEIFKRVPAPWLDNFPDARRYAQNLLDSYSTPLKSVDAKYPDLNFDVAVGESVTVIDTIRGENEAMVINSITWNAEGNTVYKCGSEILVMSEWQREVQERIKKIERRFTNEEDIIFTRLFKETLNVDVSVAQTWESASPQDTFWLNHKTLNRMKSVVNGHIENNEADCSDNNNKGIWYGTGIDGSQFTLSGWRLSAGVFNGSDNYVEVADSSSLDLTTDLSLAFAVKITTLPSAETYLFQKYDGTDGYAVRLASDNKLELVYADSGSITTFKSTTALVANTMTHFEFTKVGTALICYINGTSDNTGTGGATIGTNSNALQVARYGSDYTEMTFDELRIYNRGINASEADRINEHYHINEGMVCYLSFDNPRLGIRMSGRTPVV